MTRADIYAETYDWLTQRFGERVAEALVPCPDHQWPLTVDEQETAHAHYERWANQQEGDMSELSMTEYEQDCKPLAPPPPEMMAMKSELDQVDWFFGPSLQRARDLAVKIERAAKLSREVDDDEREVRDRETLTERLACEDEERIRAESEGTE